MAEISYPRKSSSVLAVLALACALVFPSLAQAKGCAENNNPPDSRMTPPALWDELQAVGVVQDTTKFDGNPRADSRYPLVTSLDIENGYLFNSIYAGFQIWSLAAPDAPVKLSTVDGWNGSFPLWIAGASEVDQFIHSVALADGDDNLAAIGGLRPISFSIWDTSNKALPVALYQDANTNSSGKEIQQIYAASIGGHSIAFAASMAGTGGVFAYDMTEAKNRHYSKCLEDLATGNHSCPGVYLGPVFTRASQYVHGMQLGQRHFVVRSGGSVSKPWSVDIIDVTSPASPSPVVSGLAGTFTAGVAMWSQSGNAYLAVRTLDHLQVFNVTSCLTSGCASLPGPVANVAVPRVADSDGWKSVEFSRSGSTPMLFLGHNDLCHQGESLAHGEMLFDMTDASSPREITGTKTVVDTGETVDYWSYYYSDYTRGFSYSAPRGAKFNGAYLYRADLSLLDIHKWAGGGGPPSANFSWSPATEIYPGDNVTFTDLSSGSVTSWAWTFQDGNQPTAGVRNPVISFATKGDKLVSLQAFNSAGNNTVTKTVSVLDPTPVVTSVSLVPAAPVTCSQVTWTANGLAGKPPLSASWEIRDATNALVKSGTGNPFLWDTSTGLTGTSPYTGTVTVSNGAGPSASSSSQPITLTPPLTLPGNGLFTPAFNANTAQLSVDVPGATEWCWDFGDGTSFPTGCLTGGAWSKDAVQGPNPPHSYATGSYNVKVSVRNCIDTAGATSAVLPISVTNPLVAKFQAICNFGACAFGTGDNIPFEDQSTGNPDGYFYNWNYTGTDANACGSGATGTGAVQTSHTYTAAGNYRPCLKITRGTASNVYLHGTVSVTNSTPPPPPPTPTITISGPGSGAVNAALSFTAGSSNCTPSATWNWNAAGGTLTGSGSQVSITWSTAGSRTVSVTNSGCSGATGSKSVTITASNPGGLAASFTFSPASPNAGQAVTFDGSASTGGPTAYSWTFGDGQTASTTTPTTTHTYQNAGPYTVKLEVGKPDPSCSFGLCSASTTKPITIGGGAPPLTAAFTSSVEPQCVSDFAGQRCFADTGTAVDFTATPSSGATSYSWTFGDGGTGNGTQASHTWTQPGAYTVQLTVTDGRQSAAASRLFIVSGQPVAGKKSVILPWIAQSRGALVQSSDMYLYNPASTAMDVTLTFRQRGTPETNPPKITKTIQPGATLYAGDVLRQLFNRENITGFITVDVDKGDVEPAITSFNTTFQADGSEFGQTVPGQSLSTAGSQAGSGNQVLNLVGLNDNAERLAYFGLSNPTQDTVSFTLRFYDNEGHQIGSSYDYAVAPFGHRQFLPKDIRTLFGINDQDDYRVEIRTASGAGRLYPFGANIRLGSTDPSFVGVGSSSTQKVYLLGALSTGGINNTLWQSDLVLTNTANEVVLTDVTFTAAGAASQPTQPLKLSLQAGETRRLEDVIGRQWAIRNQVGVITLDSNALTGVFPIVQGESYENTNPTKRFGQTLPALTDAQAAGPGSSQVLVGLRQDAKNRTTFWIFNPSSQFASYDVVYLGLDGHELGRINDVVLPAGRMQQLSPAQHKLPGGVAQDGFTVQVLVKGGKILTAAQVVKNATNDPAYIQGETR
jgi:PKD repeat protein